MVQVESVRIQGRHHARCTPFYRRFVFQILEPHNKKVSIIAFGHLAIGLKVIVVIVSGLIAFLLP
jgi:hypothetical protein